MGSQVSSTLPEDWATVDMVNRYTFCPRLFHLMYVQGRWADNEHTLEGKDIHRRVDRLDQLLPEVAESSNTDDEEKTSDPAGDDPPVIARSVSLGSEALGLMGKLDLVSADPEGGEAIPVETKKSKVPDNEQRSYPPERIQLMAQGLLLREHGYRSNHGYLYYAGSRSRVLVAFSAELEAETRSIIAAVRSGRAETVMPAPLDDSPKCWGCSLAGICLPDETNFLRTDTDTDTDTDTNSNITRTAGPDIRRLFAARDRATPFYVQEQGAKVGKRGERLVVSKSLETIGGAKLLEVSQVILMGNVQVSAQALHLLMQKSIPVVHFSTGGWFHGLSHGIGLENSYNRSAQFTAAADPQRCRQFAIDLVRAKATNQRALLMRNGSGPERDRAVAEIAKQLHRHFPNKNAPLAPTLDITLGHEGQAAASYFSAFSSMLKTADLPEFQFTVRNRRPPKDPVNALLSFAYALLAKETLVALWAEGLDPWWGLYHQPRHGRPALALDVMEPFRAVLADSTVITAVNTGMVRASDFVFNKNACALKPDGRKSFLRAWEQRLDQLYTHPEFDYRCSWRTILRIQSRLVARWLRGDIPHIPWPIVR